MYKNYIFDLYGTLIDLRTNENSMKVWKHAAIFYGYKGANYTPEELREEYLRLVEKEKAAVLAKSPETKTPDIELRKVFAALLEEKDVSASPELVREIAETFRCFSTIFIRLYDGVIDLLDTLKANGKKIYLLSNAQRCFTENELNMFGLTPYFDGICISSDEECCKPDEKFYRTLFERYNLEKSESIMIGNDHITDIGGAADFGIDSLYINQSISPPLSSKIRAQYKVMDGDVYKIKKLIVKYPDLYMQV